MRGIVGLKKLGIVGAFTLLSASLASAAEVTHFSANGSFATMISNDGDTSLQLAVTRNEAQKETTTNLFFNQQLCDANACSGIFGAGTIPNADFNVGGGLSRVDTNLATNPTFQCASFIQDFVNGYSQTPIPCGAIAIAWKSIPRQSNTSNGHQSSTAGPFSTHFTGQQSSDRAKANGMFFGAPIATDSSGQMGVNKSSFLQIVR